MYIGIYFGWQRDAHIPESHRLRNLPTGAAILASSPSVIDASESCS